MGDIHRPSATDVAIPPPQAAFLSNRSKSNTDPLAASRGHRKDDPLEDGLTDLDRALRSAREEIVKMQHELERFKVQQNGDPSQSRDERSSSAQDAADPDASTAVGGLNVSLLSDLQAMTDEKNFWKERHEDINEKYLRAESEVRILRVNLADREVMWRRECERRNEQLLLERDRCQEGYHAAQKTIHEREEEISELRHHALGLKRNISAWTKLEGQVSDDVFVERMKALGHDLQNWTINNFRRATLDASALSSPVRLDLASLIVSWDTVVHATSKLNFIQSIISAILVNSVFSSYYFGLDEERTKSLVEMEDYLREVAPVASINRWRSITLSLLSQAQELGCRDHIRGVVKKICCRIFHILDEITSSSGTELRERGLQSIIDRAIDLSRAFRVQRARFEVQLETSKTCLGDLEFDAATMEDVTGESDVDARHQFVKCVIFPCVIKQGDEAGDNTHLRNVLVKAKVYCGHS